ncbi:MAG: phloretin hydrolase [Clostridiales bacterium]|nr:phloretin hydrolase [Clostridiales bacterium]
MGKKVGVSQEEKNFSYYKYYEQDLAPIPEKKLAILAAGPVDPKTLIPFSERQLFLEGKDEAAGYCQIGYGVLEDGTAHVCNTTYMPGVTGEMLDWWFPWHSVGSDLRYKIWDPEDHYFARADRADYVTDPAIPMNERTWGVNHYIMEDVGPGPEFLKLMFKKPSDMGYDMSAIGTEKCQSMVCAIGESSVAAAMTHKWYPYQDGVMFCSRFWIGYRWTEDGQIVKAIPDGFSIPLMAPQGLYAHNIKEFTNLAAVLPTLYEEEKDIF